MKSLPRPHGSSLARSRFGKAFENIPKRDFRFHARERRAEARVNSVTERDVRIRIAHDVEAVRVGNCFGSRLADPTMARINSPGFRLWPWSSIGSFGVRMSH